jgi:hypothetical protein
MQFNAAGQEFFLEGKWIRRLLIVSEDVIMIILDEMLLYSS